LLGDSRNSQGTLPTDKLFTGQRLDSTGLYYYGARYYDSTIGRFISPDTLVCVPSNPQSLNRYSYVINNPLKYTDPSGLDYVVALGSGQEINSEADLDYWYNYVHSNFPVKEGEVFIFLPDTDPTGLFGTDVGPRLSALNDIMGIGALTDIKLVGYSEGAATVATFLSNLADNPGSCNNFSDLTAAFLLETPTWGTTLPHNYDPGCLNDLPSRLKGVTLADIWNTNSGVHISGILPGWEKDVNSFRYDSFTPQESQMFAMLAPEAQSSYILSHQLGFHGDIVKPNNPALQAIASALLVSVK
jgi:RHS repeat-associated protein